MSVVTKALALLPALIKMVRDIEEKVKAAKGEASPGGAKVTPDEILLIVAAETAPFIKAIVALFVAE